MRAEVHRRAVALTGRPADNHGVLLGCPGQAGEDVNQPQRIWRVGLAGRQRREPPTRAPTPFLPVREQPCVGAVVEHVAAVFKVDHALSVVMAKIDLGRCGPEQSLTGGLGRCGQRAQQPTLAAARYRRQLPCVLDQQLDARSGCGTRAFAGQRDGFDCIVHGELWIQTGYPTVPA